MKKLVFSLLCLIFLVLSSGFTSAKPIYGELPDEGPALQIQKWVTTDSVELGQNLTVFVNITNWSNDWAFNLSITEPGFDDFFVKRIRGYKAYDWDMVGPGASFSYDYTLEPQREGNFTIEPTIIEFFDENKTLHRAKSSFIPFFVFVDQPPVTQKEAWNTILWVSLGIFGFPVIIFVINKYFWRKD